MSRLLTRTALGGESATPPYEYLRGRLRDAFMPAPEALTRPYSMQRHGSSWLVLAGIINDPDRSWHEYGIVYRSTETPGGTWYEAEVRNAADEPIMCFGFAPEAGYVTQRYDVESGGSRMCFDSATLGHCAIMLSMLDRTLFDDRMSMRAATEDIN
ncbi:MAG TPA: hypothetical protein VFM05_06380 [Candidatus Saccharimonadales bacterium]|nr:hypothetical protein [Candidatus Saccharimonadales bacterium]